MHLRGACWPDGVKKGAPGPENCRNLSVFWTSFWAPWRPKTVQMRATGVFLQKNMFFFAMFFRMGFKSGFWRLLDAPGDGPESKNHVKPLYCRTKSRWSQNPKSRSPGSPWAPFWSTFGGSREAKGRFFRRSRLPEGARGPKKEVKKWSWKKNWKRARWGGCRRQRREGRAGEGGSCDPDSGEIGMKFNTACIILNDGPDLKASPLPPAPGNL